MIVSTGARQNFVTDRPGIMARMDRRTKHSREDSRKNRSYWDRSSDEYQERHGPQLNTRPLAWGLWSIPESQLVVLGDVRNQDVLELGCGGGQWSMFLEQAGARPVGLDNSFGQLRHARRLLGEADVMVPLVQASAERLPFRDGAFDVVFCDHGAMSFADPGVTIPEAARVLRPGGLLAFNMTTSLLFCCWNEWTEKVEERLSTTYFGMRRFEYSEGMVEYQLPVGEWIRLLRGSGLQVEDLIELQAPEGATTTYDELVPLAWARRWPAENIWKARKPGA
jgi:SAM-dependent methyltransferase